MPRPIGDILTCCFYIIFRIRLFKISLTSGQVWAAGKVVVGSGLIIAGTVTLPEGVFLIGFGIPILADGAASSFVEFALDGDTSAVPHTMNHAIYLIVEGAVKSDYGGNKNCEEK